MEFLQGPALQAQAVYILGDLFDVWVGEDISPPFHFDLLNAFKTLVQNNIALNFIAGNRDFLISTPFLEKMAATRLDERSKINIHGVPTLLMHGDILCTQDKGYQLYRKIAQHPLTRFLFLKLPRKTRENIARKLREKSRSYQQGKPLSILDVDNTAVELEMQKNNVLQLIHGHVHRPNIHTVKLLNNQMGKRVVLGDWSEECGSMIICTPHNTTLAEFRSGGKIIPQSTYTLEVAFSFKD